MLVIDGSIGEGGGQILRTSLALSCILKKPFRMINIRAGRKEPGLRPQHLTSVSAAKTICGAAVSGDKVGLMEITFEPGETKPGSYRFEVGTAGSVALVLHTIYLPLALSGDECRVKIAGGTHVDWSPPFDHLENCWARSLGAMGIRLDLELLAAGFYPRGGGRIDVKIAPAAQIKPVSWLERGPLKKLTVRAGVANLQEEIARRMLSTSRRFTRERGFKKDVLDEDIYRPPCPTEGAYFFLLAEFEPPEGSTETPPPAGFVSLGRKGKRAEIVVEEAWKELDAFLSSTAPVEPRLADQLLLPLSVATARSEFRTSSLTNHLKTNAAVIEAFGAAMIKMYGVSESGSIAIFPGSDFSN